MQNLILNLNFIKSIKVFNYNSIFFGKFIKYGIKYSIYIFSQLHTF